MEYTIARSENDQYILLKVRGEITGKAGLKMTLETHALGMELNIHRYLVDVTEARNTDTIMGNYQFAHSDMQRGEGLDKLARVATLVSPGDHSHDFVETVCHNAGLNVRLFTDIEEAKRFLAEDPSPRTADSRNFL